MADILRAASARGKPVAELRLAGSGKSEIRLPFGYGEGTVSHLAAEFDELLEDMRDYTA
jgi:hypothetical protein